MPIANWYIPSKVSVFFSSLGILGWATFVSGLLFLASAIHYTYLAIVDLRQSNDSISVNRAKHDLVAGVINFLASLLAFVIVFLTTDTAPLSQPVADVSASAWVVLNTTNEVESGEDWNHSTQALLSTGLGNGVLSSSAEFEELVSDKVTPLMSNGHQGFIIDFHSHITDLAPTVKYPRLTVSQALARLTSTRLDLLFVPAFNGVLSGKIELVVNGGVGKTFVISPQLGATNSDPESHLFIVASNVLEETTFTTAK